MRWSGIPSFLPPGVLFYSFPDAVCSALLWGWFAAVARSKKTWRRNEMFREVLNSPWTFSALEMRKAVCR